MRPIPPWVNEAFLNCPCGSGIPFKGCCRDVLKSSEADIKVGARTPALRRAELARYIGWVFRNTQPLIEAGVPANELLIANVDLYAIEEMARRVAFDMRDAPPTEVLALFSRLEQYLHALPGLSDAVLSL